MANAILLSEILLKGGVKGSKGIQKESSDEKISENSDFFSKILSQLDNTQKALLTKNTKEIEKLVTFTKSDTKSALDIKELKNILSSASVKIRQLLVASEEKGGAKSEIAANTQKTLKDILNLAETLDLDLKKLKVQSDIPAETVEIDVQETKGEEQADTKPIAKVEAKVQTLTPQESLPKKPTLKTLISEEKQPQKEKIQEKIEVVEIKESKPIVKEVKEAKEEKEVKTQPLPQEKIQTPPKQIQPKEKNLEETKPLTTKQVVKEEIKIEVLEIPKIVETPKESIKKEIPIQESLPKKPTLKTLISEEKNPKVEKTQESQEIQPKVKIEKETKTEIKTQEKTTAPLESKESKIKTLETVQTPPKETQPKEKKLKTPLETQNQITPEKIETKASKGALAELLNLGSIKKQESGGKKIETEKTKEAKRNDPKIQTKSQSLTLENSDVLRDAKEQTAQAEGMRSSENFHQSILKKTLFEGGIKEQSEKKSEKVEKVEVAASTESKQNALVANVQNLQKTESAQQTKESQYSQTFQRFAEDLKEEIQEYKSPFKKITMELNPKNLGNLEVTIRSIGNNLQVSITSSQVTLQMFLQNSGEFRNSLANAGFQNVEMSFNAFSGDGGGGGNQHAKGGREYRNANSLYQKDDDQSNIGEISSLELTLPRYI